MDTVRGSWWLGTLNNPTELDRQTIHGPAPRWLRMVKGQDEIGENGTLHIQFALNTRQVRLSAIKEWLPRAHLEVARNANAVANYVSKDRTAVANSQFEHNYVSENANKTMADIMIMLAEVAQLEDTAKKLKTLDVSNKLPKPDDVYKAEYWSCVELLLGQDENLVGLLTQPQYERSWVKTRRVWIAKLALDSQTKISVGYGSPVPSENSDTIV